MRDSTAPISSGSSDTNSNDMLPHFASVTLDQQFERRIAHRTFRAEKEAETAGDLKLTGLNHKELKNSQDKSETILQQNIKHSVKRILETKKVSLGDADYLSMDVNFMILTGCSTIPEMELPFFSSFTVCDCTNSPPTLIVRNLNTQKESTILLEKGKTLFLDGRFRLEKMDFNTANNEVKLMIISSSGKINTRTPSSSPRLDSTQVSPLTTFKPLPNMHTPPLTKEQKQLLECNYAAY